MASKEKAAPRWSVEDIPYDRVEKERVAGDRDLFYFLAGASFVEITSDLFTRSMIEFFEGDAEVAEWLKAQWEPEELQHGEALKRYVLTVWPSFDWERAYAGFRREYAPLCTTQLLGPSRGQELASRCVVETGTSTIYTMVQNFTDEPVLQQLAGRIRSDEVGHYSHFYRYFKRYRQAEHLGRIRILRALWERVAEVDDEDAYYAFRNVLAVCDADAEPVAAFREYRHRTAELVHRNYPYRMAVRMLLKPLDLNRYVQRLAVPLVTVGARRFLEG